MIAKYAIALIALIVLAAVFAWAFLPARYLPGNRARHLRIRLHSGFPSNRGGFLIADSCNFAASSEYRTPVHFVPWRSFVCPGRGIRTRRALGGAGWGLPVLPA